MFLLLGVYFKNPPSCDIDFNIQTDFDLFDDSLAHSIKVKPLENEIRNLEIVMSHIVKEMDSLVGTEKILRSTNESINDRVRYLSVVSIFAFIGCSILQMVYMKKYLKSKKLI